jgi:hypothetical protein
LLGKVQTAQKFYENRKMMKNKAQKMCTEAPSRRERSDQINSEDLIIETVSAVTIIY